MWQKIFICVARQKKCKILFYLKIFLGLIYLFFLFCYFFTLSLLFLYSLFTLSLFLYHFSKSIVIVSALFSLDSISQIEEDERNKNNK